MTKQQIFELDTASFIRYNKINTSQMETVVGILRRLCKNLNIEGVLEMPEKEYQLPPKIQELLKKKGWSWPLDEKTKAQIHEAMGRFTGGTHIPEAEFEDLFGDNPRFSYILNAKKLR